MAAMMMYMNVGIRRTVWLCTSQNTVGMETKNEPTTGSMNVLPGLMRPTSRPPVNQTGTTTTMPLPPSKSSAVMTIGRPMTRAPVSTAWTTIEMIIQRTLKPSCW